MDSADIAKQIKAIQDLTAKVLAGGPEACRQFLVDATIIRDMSQEYKYVMEETEYRKDGKLWCRVTARTLTELRSLADIIGLRQDLFYNETFPYYETNSKIIRNRAEKEGVVTLSRKNFVNYLHRHYGKQSSNSIEPSDGISRE